MFRSPDKPTELRGLRASLHVRRIVLQWQVHRAGLFRLRLSANTVPGWTDLLRRHVRRSHDGPSQLRRLRQVVFARLCVL